MKRHEAQGWIIGLAAFAAWACVCPASATPPPAAAATPAPAPATVWIGRVVPPYPDGLKSNTGSCVGSGSAPEQICARSIGTLDDAQDRSLKFYAGEFAGREGNEPRWKITDVIPYPKLKRGEYVSVATCQRDGVDDPGLIAIVDTAVENAAEQETFEARRWAMRLDRDTGKFVEVPPASVRCYNEGFGAE
ncbi:MAG: hypothetical protein HOQ32_18525 [Lysobacter sp.]|nr:hypothetical protein [Lysobacter sp.]